MGIKLSELKDAGLRRRLEAILVTGGATPLKLERGPGIALPPIKTPQRLRQDKKPVLNGLETAFYEHLKRTLPPGTLIHCQAWRVQIARGAWFKVDFCASVAGQWTAWETKGPKTGKNVARGMLALKCAAANFPDVNWVLAWKDNGEWFTQKVLS